MSTLRNDFDDDSHWAELARRYYVRLPQWRTPVTAEKQRFWLRKFRITEQHYLKMCGYKSLSDFSRLNPDWPLRAWVGLLLEYINERDSAGRVLAAYDR